MRKNIENEAGLERLARVIAILVGAVAVAVVGVIAWGLLTLWSALT